MATTTSTRSTPAKKPSARTRRAAAGCAVFTSVVVGAVALVWSSCVISNEPSGGDRRGPVKLVVRIDGAQ